MFHLLIERIDMRWQATTTLRTNPKAINTTIPEKINGYVCVADEHILNKIYIASAPAGMPRTELTNN